MVLTDCFLPPPAGSHYVEFEPPGWLALSFSLSRTDTGAWTAAFFALSWCARRWKSADTKQFLLCRSWPSVLNRNSSLLWRWRRWCCKADHPCELFVNGQNMLFLIFLMCSQSVLRQNIGCCLLTASPTRNSNYHAGKPSKATFQEDSLRRTAVSFILFIIIGIINSLHKYFPVVDFGGQCVFLSDFSIAVYRLSIMAFI